MPNGLQKGTSVDLKNCVLFLKTKALGADDLLWMALKFGEGNLQHTINKSYDYKMNRGKLDDVRRGPDQVLSVSFEGKFTNLLSNYGGESDETYSLHEILDGVEYGVEDHGEPKFAGTRETWLNAYGCPPYCVDIEIHNNPGMECPDSEALGEAQLIRYFRATSIAADFSSGMVNVSGEAHVLRPVVMRVGVLDSGVGTNQFTYVKEEEAEPMDAALWGDDPRAA